MTLELSPVACIRSQPTEKVFSPVHMMKRVITAVPKLSKCERCTFMSPEPPNSCRPRMANTVMNRRNTRQKLPMRTTPLITARNTVWNARYCLRPLRPARMRITRSMRRSATPSAPLPIDSSKTPEMTMMPSMMFHRFDQYHSGPYARCLITNSTMNTMVKVSSQPSRTS